LPGRRIFRLVGSNTERAPERTQRRCACCRSSYFIHVRPTETRTLARIPRELLFAAPGQPKGHVLLGYYENGRCPMLNDSGCSIYADRPNTCRTYDCRIFTAAGITADEADKTPINLRVHQWKFSYPTQRDRDRHAAVKSAAEFIQKHAECFLPEIVPRYSTQLAILALKVYAVFLKCSGKNGRVSTASAIAKASMEANAKF
jgi:uncharacterized protein